MKTGKDIANAIICLRMWVLAGDEAAGKELEKLEKKRYVEEPES